MSQGPVVARTTPVAGDSPLSRIPFTADDEATVKSLSTWMTVAGVIGLLAGIVTMISHVLNRNAGIIGPILDIVVSVLVLLSAGAFRKVATTDTADQAHLVDGFERLRLIFLIQSIRVIVGLVFLAAVMLILLAIVLTKGGQW